MMPKPLLLLAALTLCCCIMTIHASPRCKCIRTSSKIISLKAIMKIEVLPISGQCRWTEIIVTRKNGMKVCIDPSTPWIKQLLTNLQKKNEAPTETTLSPTAPTSVF
ncbi:C-X-C motif chemokine 13 isoform X1 [Seriola lalandi dorsalis]|uniref:C-X-C motif chemokine ligand 13 n=1 Tax=Seriola lalandi dorsalis TaxID=1841481 RepID=A0A3B4W9U6_SERLL|nr:C-X-C motif chemokine 13 isoform X1 [Seriola lalandi dorsalis]